MLNRRQPSYTKRQVLAEEEGSVSASASAEYSLVPQRYHSEDEVPARRCTLWLRSKSR